MCQRSKVNRAWGKASALGTREEREGIHEHTDPHNDNDENKGKGHGLEVELTHRCQFWGPNWNAKSIVWVPHMQDSDENSQDEENFGGRGIAASI